MHSTKHGKYLRAHRPQKSANAEAEADSDATTRDKVAISGVLTAITEAKSDAASPTAPSRARAGSLNAPHERVFFDAPPQNRGPPALQRVAFPASNFDRATWPTRVHADAARLPRAAAMYLYALSPEEILYVGHYRGGGGARRWDRLYPMHALERVAWEKYGGPRGLAAALQQQRAREEKEAGLKGRGGKNGGGDALRKREAGVKPKAGAEEVASGESRMEGAGESHSQPLAEKRTVWVEKKPKKFYADYAKGQRARDVLEKRILKRKAEKHARMEREY